MDETGSGLSRGAYVVTDPRYKAPIPTLCVRPLSGRSEPAYALRAAIRDGPLIATTDGRPLIPERASDRWHALRARAGLDGLRFHDLRGTYATLALASGVPPKALADVLGHETGVLLRTYGGPIENGRKAIATAIEGARSRVVTSGRSDMERD